MEQILNLISDYERMRSIMENCFSLANDLDQMCVTDDQKNDIANLKNELRQEFIELRSQFEHRLKKELQTKKSSILKPLAVFGLSILFCYILTRM